MEQEANITEADIRLISCPEVPDSVTSPDLEGCFRNYLGFKEHIDCIDYLCEIVNAWVGGQLVGSIVFGRNYGAMWVYHIYVEFEYRERGIGRKLMNEAVWHARYEGLRIDGDFTDSRGALKDYMNSLLDQSGKT